MMLRFLSSKIAFAHTMYNSMHTDETIFKITSFGTSGKIGELNNATYIDMDKISSYLFLNGMQPGDVIFKITSRGASGNAR